MRRVAGFLLALCTLVTIGASAQQTVAPADAPSREEVMQLLQLLHIRDRMMQMLAGMKEGMRTGAEAGFKQKVPDPTPEQLKTLDAIVDSTFEDFPIDEMVDAMVPIYQRHLNKNDLDAVIAFYSSPPGQKILKEQPAMMAESMRAGQKIMLAKLPELTKRLNDRIEGLIQEQKQKPADNDSKDTGR